MNLRFTKEVFNTKSLFNSNKFILSPIKCAWELDFICFSYVVFSNSESSMFQIIIGLIVHCEIQICDVFDAALMKYQLLLKLPIQCNQWENKLYCMCQFVLKKTSTLIVLLIALNWR